MSLYARLAALIVVVLAIAGLWWKFDRMLAAADRAGYERRVGEEQAVSLAKAHENAKETQRRLERQEDNQRAQDAELARLRAAADRADAAARRVRQQATAAAREWSARLADSPTAEDLAAAGEAVRVCTDLLGRADRRAGILAGYADAARTAGEKCVADYEALTKE